MKKVFSPCPVETTLQLLENKWRVLIIRDLIDDKRRFGELKKSVSGISQRSLTLNLRAMEDSGLINRKIYAEVPPKVEYSLTDIGKSLLPVLKSLEQWGNLYKSKLL